MQALMEMDQYEFDIGYDTPHPALASYAAKQWDR